MTRLGFIAILLLGVGVIADDNKYNGVVNLARTALTSVTGTINFKFDEHKAEVFVDVNLQTGENWDVKIHEFAADFGKEDPCAMIGATYSPGSVISASMGNLADLDKGANTAAITGSTTDAYQVVGRSVALYHVGTSNMTACFPIIASSARYFRSKIGNMNGMFGEVTLAQVKLSNNDTRMFFNSKIQRTSGNNMYNLRMATGALYKTVDICPTSVQNEETLVQWGTNGDNGLRQDTGATGSVYSTDPTAVVIRHWWSTGLGGTSNAERVCANVFNIKSKQATAYIYQDGLVGSIVFTQESPYHPVVVKAGDTETLVFLNSITISKAFFSEYTVPKHETSYMSREMTCSLLFDKDYTTVDSPIFNVNGYSTNEITMFGPSSIIGRAMFFQIMGRTYCANVKKNGDNIRRIADFHGKLGGDLVLEQDTENRWDDVTVYNSLYTQSGVITRNTVQLYASEQTTLENNVGTERCPRNSLGNQHTLVIFDPDNTDVFYNSACTPDWPYQCAQGSLYYRLGSLDVQLIHEEVKWTQVLHDSFLSLSGVYEISDDFNIFDSSSTSKFDLDCARIKEVGSLEYVAEISYSDGAGTSAKSIYKDTDGSLTIRFDDNTGKTEMEANFDTNTKVSTLSIRENTVPTSRSGYPYVACSKDVLGSVLDFGLGEINGAGVYVTGNISTRYTVAGQSDISFTDETFDFDVFSGAYSPAYRSVRLGLDNDEGTDEDYVCANLVPDLSDSNGEIESGLYAVFNGQPSHGPLRGEIIFRQVSYTSSSPSWTYRFPTNVQYDLTNPEDRHDDDDVSFNHRIYITKYTSCNDFPTSNVRIHDDLYNPYSVPVQHSNQAEFPAMGVVGDVSSKSRYITVGKRGQMNVENLPLNGTFSVEGKAMVITDSVTHDILGCSVITSQHLNSGVTVTLSATLVSLILAIFYL